MFYLLDILSYAEALYDFQGNSPNMLTLHKGDNIAVLDKAGNQKGWWKGKIDKNVNISLLLQNIVSVLLFLFKWNLLLFSFKLLDF